MRLSRRRKIILALITAGAVYLGPASSEAQAYIAPATSLFAGASLSAGASPSAGA